MCNMGLLFCDTHSVSHSVSHRHMVHMVNGQQITAQYQGLMGLCRWPDLRMLLHDPDWLDTRH